eukprot:g8393.t1
MAVRYLERRFSILGRQRNALPIEPLSVVKDQNDDDECLCRFCWQAEDDDRGGELLAPCRCSGSVKYIHRRCLGAWQRTQRSQGALRKSYRCDICKERYRVRRAPFSGAQLPFGRLPTTDEGKELLYSIIGCPIWHVAFDIWKMMILINGGYCATSFGMRGLRVGCLQGWNNVMWYIASMKNCGAEIAVLATVFKFLQLPAVLLTIGGGALTALQFVVHAIVGFYCAALFGFAQGSTQVLKATAIVALSLCTSGFGAAVSTVGRTFHRAIGLVRSLLPYVQQLGSAIILSELK